MANSENAIFNHDPGALLEDEMRNMVPGMHYNGSDVADWQATLRHKLSELIGLDRKPTERCDLNVKSLWTREHAYGRIEKIVFTSEKNYDVPAYVCIPHNAKAPMPFFICLQGHSTGMHNSIAVAQDDESKTIEIEGDRDFAIACMERGLAAICIEQRAFGECEDPKSDRHRCHLPSVMTMMLGRTLLGERVFDVDRTIDYLERRGDVDMTRIGVMGNSGGGTTTMFAGALLDRITHIMPSSCFSSFKDSIMSMDHCICNYVPNLLVYAEVSDVLGVAAPKPVVIVNGNEDPIFPIGAAKDSFEELKEIYKRFGAEAHCHHVICDGGHRFYADAAWAAMLPELK